MPIVYSKNVSSTVDIKIIFRICWPKRRKTSKRARANRGKDFPNLPTRDQLSDLDYERICTSLASKECLEILGFGDFNQFFRLSNICYRDLESANAAWEKLNTTREFRNVMLSRLLTRKRPFYKHVFSRQESWLNQVIMVSDLYRADDEVQVGVVGEVLGRSIRLSS